MSHAYAFPFVNLPRIIDGPGNYYTRAGELVTIKFASDRPGRNCNGWYDDGKAKPIYESWDRSGRLFAGVLSDNDVVMKADGHIPPECQLWAIDRRYYWCVEYAGGKAYGKNVFPATTDDFGTLVPVPLASLAAVY